MHFLSKRGTNYLTTNAVNNKFHTTESYYTAGYIKCTTKKDQIYHGEFCVAGNMFSNTKRLKSRRLVTSG